MRMNVRRNSVNMCAVVVNFGRFAPIVVPHAARRLRGTTVVA
jgi:hypothetical protein